MKKLLSILATTLAISTHALAIDFADPNTRFIAVDNFIYLKDSNATSYSVSGYYSPKAGGRPARISILPRVTLDIDDIAVINNKGRKVSFSRRSDTDDISTLSIPLSYSGQTPNGFEGASIAASIEGTRIDYFDHWPQTQSPLNTFPTIYGPATGHPIGGAVMRDVGIYINTRAGPSRDWMTKWEEMTAETASMDTLRVSLLIDGVVISERNMKGSAVLRNRLPALAITAPSLVTYNRIREGTFEVELTYSFIDRNVGTIDATYDYASMMSNYINQSRQAYTRSKSSGWSFFGIGSRKNSIKQSFKDSDQRNTRFESRTKTLITIEDAPDRLIEQFESNFFPTLSDSRAKQNHFKAAEAATNNGNDELAKAHLDYARALDTGNLDIEKEAMAEAALALSTGNYAMFLAKGIRFQNNSGSNRSSFSRVISQEASESITQEWQGSSTRSVARNVNVLVNPDEDREYDPYTGLCGGDNWAQNYYNGFMWTMHTFFIPTCIVQGSPIANAGVMQGMLIYSIGGNVIQTQNDYEDTMRFYVPGDTLPIVLVDGSGQQRQVNVRVGIGGPKD